MDIGAGSLRDSFYLMEQFKKIIAIDNANCFLENEYNNILSINISIDNFSLKENHFALVNAYQVTQYIEKSRVQKLFNRIYHSMVDEGILVVTFIGDRDEWNFSSMSKFSCFTKEEVLKILECYKIMYLDEKEYNAPSLLSAQKKWHVFHVIAKKILTEGGS